MPQKSAYNAAEIIATGLALEPSGPATPRAIHTALGGRGTRDAVASVWEAFLAERDARMPGSASVDGANLPPEIARDVSEILTLAVGIAQKMAAETDAKHDRRAGHDRAQIDALLKEREALLAEIEALRAEHAEQSCVRTTIAAE